MSNQAKIDYSDLRKFESGLADVVGAGDEVEDAPQKCLKLCQQFLAGIWSQLTVNDIEIKRLTGGMCNHSYHCKVVDSLQKDCIEPREVVIRFYGHKWDWSLSPNASGHSFYKSLIAQMVSNNEVGPHVYGLFKEGQIQKYYPHRHSEENDLNDPHLLLQLASKLARFHASEAPTPKTFNWMKLFLTSSSKQLQDSKQKWRETFKKYECKTLMDCDMSSEIKWLLKLIPSLDSPVVFTHNDLRFPNIMISSGEVVFGDVEFSSYYNRGLDFASFFHNSDQNKGIIKEFIREYLKEGEKIFGKSYSENANNSVEHILQEMKCFSLVYSLFVSNIFLYNNGLAMKIPFDERTSIGISDNLLAKYLAIKKTLIESKMIQPSC